MLELLGARARLDANWGFEPAVVLTDLGDNFMFYEFSEPPADPAQPLHCRRIVKTTRTNATDGLCYLNELLDRTAPMIRSVLPQAPSRGATGGGGGRDTDGHGEAGAGRGQGTGGAASRGHGSASGGGRGGGGSGGGGGTSALRGVASGGTSLRSGDDRVPLRALSHEELAAFDAQDAAAVLVNVSGAAVELLQKPGVAEAFGFDKITSLRVNYCGETIVRGFGTV